MLLALCFAALSARLYALVGAQRQKEECVLVLCAAVNVVELFSESDKLSQSTLEASQVKHVKFNPDFLNLTRLSTPRCEKALHDYLVARYSSQKIDPVMTVGMPRQHQLWDISEGRRQAGSLLQIRRPSFWVRHNRLVIEVILLIAAESIVIMLLLIQRRKRKLAEVSLRRSEARYSAFVANSSEGIARFEANEPMPISLLWDKQVDYLLQHFHLAECNDAFARMYGFDTSQDIVGDRLENMLQSATAHNLEFLHAFVRSEYKLSNYMKQERDRQGVVRWFENRATGILEDGCLARIWVVQRDISDRRQAEEALKQEVAFNKLMNSLLHSLSICASTEVDACVEKALQGIAEFVGADHAFVIEFQADKTGWSITHEWCGLHVTPKRHQFQSVPVGTMPHHERLLLDGDIVRVDSPGDCFLDAVEEQRLQENEGYVSSLIVPTKIMGGIFGCIGLHTHARPVSWSDNDVACLQMVGDTVATTLQRQKSIQALRKSEEKFSMAFHGSPVGMTILYLSTGRYLEVNKAFQRNTGYRVDEILGRTPEELGIYTNPVGMELGNPATAHASFQGREIQYQTKSGEPRVALLSIEKIEFDGETCVLHVFEDVTERKRIESNLRELGMRMLMVQEEERRHVARELHDDFSQRLALVAIDLEQLALRPPTTKKDWINHIRALLSQTQELSSDIHRLSHMLHPSRLEELGLVAAVRCYCRELLKQAQLRVEFCDDNVPPRLPREIALCLYRIVQESLRNIIKHSGAKTAVVELKGKSEEVQLKIFDSGKGFDGETAKKNRGLGLIGMHERVLAVGGEISIWSRHGAGTRVEVRIPIPSSAHEEHPAVSSGADA